MSDPKGPFEAAVRAAQGYQTEQERAIRYLSAAGIEITAEATRYLLRLLDDARRALRASLLPGEEPS